MILKGTGVDKAADAFRTISEVADDLRLPQHVLRFWESRFSQIKPMKRAGGRRYYRPEDVDLLRGIHYLLYGEGYTIRGVQRILKEQGVKFVEMVWREGAEQPGASPREAGSGIVPDRDGLEETQDETEAQDEAELQDEIVFTQQEVRVSRTSQHPVANPALAVESPREREMIAHVAPSQGMALSRNQLHRLQAALFELHECKRLLETVMRKDAQSAF